MSVAQANPKSMSRLGLIFRSLRYRNFRLFFIGQGISLIGTWMQMIAGGWLAYELTAGESERTRALWLGIVAFSGRIPTFVFAPFAGVLVDRWNRFRLVIITQVFAMFQAALLATLTLSHTITLGYLILLSLVLGLINALDVPGRQSFMIEMVDNREHLNNAIALNSSLVNSARIIGPAIAGILLKTTGAGFCFLLNAVSYIPVITALLAMKVKPVERKLATDRIFSQLAAGVRYAFGFPPIRNMLLLLALVSLSGASYTVLLPILAEHVLHRGSGLYALLFAAAGAGALAGALLLAMRESARGLSLWIAAAPAIFGIGLIALGVSRFVWLSVLVMPVVGFGMLVQLASCNTVLQTLVDDSMRGRVMSLYSMAFMGMVPLGSLLSGFMARLVGSPVTLILNGAWCIVGSLLFFAQLKKFRRLIHPIYVEKGIIRTAPAD